MGTLIEMLLVFVANSKALALITRASKVIGLDSLFIWLKDLITKLGATAVKQGLKSGGIEFMKQHGAPHVTASTIAKVTSLAGKTIANNKIKTIGIAAASAALAAGTVHYLDDGTKVETDPEVTTEQVKEAIPVSRGDFARAVAATAYKDYVSSMYEDGISDGHSLNTFLEDMDYYEENYNNTVRPILMHYNLSSMKPLIKLRDFVRMDGDLIAGMALLESTRGRK